MSYQFRLTVSGGPDGDASSDWTFDGDRITAAAAGEPQLTMTVVHKDFEKLADGSLLPTVAYMQGLLKSTGDNAMMLDLLAHSATPEFLEWRSQLTV